MVCLHCGKKLTMVKKFTSDEFCSVAHRQAYQAEQERLVVERLQEQGLRLKGGPKQLKASLAEIAGAAQAGKARGRKEPGSAEGPAEGGYVAHSIATRQTPFSSLWASSLRNLPFEPGISLKAAEARPAAPGERTTRGLAATKPPSNFLRAKETGGPALGAEAAARSFFRSAEALSPKVDTPGCFAPSWPARATMGAGTPLAVSIGPRAPATRLVTIYERLDCECGALLRPLMPAPSLSPLAAIDERLVNFESMELAGCASLPDSIAMAPPPPVAALESHGAKRLTFSRLPLAAGIYRAPSYSPSTAVLADFEFACSPASISLNFSAPRPEHRQFVPQRPRRPVAGLGVIFAPIRGSLDIPCPPVAAAGVHRMVPADALPLDLSMAKLSYPISELFPRKTSGPLKCRVLAAPPAVAPRKPNLLSTGECVPSGALCVPGARRIYFGSMLSQGVSSLCVSSLACLPAGFVRSISPPALEADSTPLVPKARIAALRRSGALPLSQIRCGAKQFVLPFQIAALPAERAPVPREPLVMRSTKASLPALQLKALPARHSQSRFAALRVFNLSSAGVQKYWEAAPKDLRRIAYALPFILGLIWFSGLPAGPGNSGLLAKVMPKEDDIDGIKGNIQRRAAVELSDDFRQGLGEWSGSGDWAKGWSYDKAGFIRPRQLALYAPSIPLQDYRFEFLGQIERNALSWVFRAADLKNYYTSRLEVVAGGPLPKVELVRYAVIDGVRGPKKSIPLPMQVFADTIYRVRVDVQGSVFVTLIQGTVVDVFSDDRFSRGGVGFSSGKGEEARLRWVEVSHQYDFLGRLCAFLIPYNVSNFNERSAP